MILATIFIILFVLSAFSNVILLGQLSLSKGHVNALVGQRDKYQLEAIEAKKLKELAPVPVCQCKHGYSLHTEENGCQERLGKTSDGVTTAQTFFCPCARYTGPVPLPQFYAPELDL